ncbi:MAG TPA: EamA family transporter RarD [Croceibacterium sp.]|nr:EamA family transporter RarD [Croceibacterium sp.]
MSDTSRGLLLALGAHVFWGSMPLYLLLIGDAPALEFVAWRILFTVPLCVLLVAVTRRGKELRAVIANRRALLLLLASSALIGVNWFLYVWAIVNGHVYAASLGYYILPLVMMLLGLATLGERMNRRQWLAAGLAGTGVAVLAAGALTTMWLSLAMAITFGLYGLVRKMVSAGPLAGLTIEVVLLAPPSAALLWWLGTHEGLHFGDAWGTSLAIAMSAPMTGIPLLLFAAAARLLPYTLVGFVQFSSPTIVFLIGLLVFGERLNPAQLACYVLIWLAVAIFVWDLFAGRRKARAAAS